MSAELDAYRAELRAAGQPWSNWGARVVAAGFVLLAGAQVIVFFAVAQITAQGAIALLGLAVVLIAAGWVMLVKAFLSRRRWAKAHPPGPLAELADR